ncbi:MAG: hypothetical protein HOA81_05220 [Opitutales bacterium]|nr:hypothetical protein [Opitutales bacterium]
MDRSFSGGRLFPDETLGLHEILIEFIENELELATFKLVDPHYVETIDDIVNRVRTIRHIARRFGIGCVDRWRAQVVGLRHEADRLLVRFEPMLKTSDYLFG